MQELKIYIASNDIKLDYFPDYVAGLTYQFSFGTFDSIKPAFSESISIPFTDWNANALGIDRNNPQRIPKIEIYVRDYYDNVSVLGYLYVEGFNIGVPPESIQIRILDKLSYFVEEAKKTKLYELIDDGQYNHKFQLARTEDGFDGFESLLDHDELVRYGYTDYNGYGRNGILATHRHWEDITNSDGIQQIQPMFKVTELFKRSLSLFGLDYVSKFIDDTSETDWATSDLYVNFPMRYHGFDLEKRSSTVICTSRRLMVCGLPESTGGGQPSPYTNSCKQNFKDRNRVTIVKSNKDDANGFNIFLRRATIAHEDWADTGFSAPFKILVQRTGEYKINVSGSMQPINLFLVGVSQSGNPSAFQRFIKSITGNIQLKLGVSVNGQFPTLYNVKSFTSANFTGQDSITLGIDTYYRYFKTSSFTLNETIQDTIQVKLGDFVEMFWVLDSDDAYLDIARPLVADPYVSKKWEELCNYDEANASISGNLHWNFNNAAQAGITNPYTEMTFGYNEIGTPSLPNYTGISNQFTVKFFAEKEYPLCSIPEKFGNNLYLEEVNLKENVKAFADYTIYDVLNDIMKRFNLSIFYEAENDRVFIDNFPVEYIAGYGTPDAIRKYLDDYQDIAVTMNDQNILSVSYTNASGNSVKDKVLGSIGFGNLEEHLINQEGVDEISWQSMMAIANGQCFGDRQVFTDIDEDNDFVKQRVLAFIPQRENLQVSQYGMRIGFLAENNSVSVAMKTPHRTSIFAPSASNVYDYVRYRTVQRNGFELPVFVEYRGVTISMVKVLHHLEFGYKEGGEIKAEPTTVTNAYEAWHKKFIDDYFSGVSIEADFVLSIAEADAIRPHKLVDFGFGACVIEDVGTLDMYKDRTKVRCKFKKLG